MLISVGQVDGSPARGRPAPHTLYSNKVDHTCYLHAIYTHMRVSSHEPGLPASPRWECRAAARTHRS